MNESWKISESVEWIWVLYYKFRFGHCSESQTLIPLPAENIKTNSNLILGYIEAEPQVTVFERLKYLRDYLLFVKTSPQILYADIHICKVYPVREKKKRRRSFEKLP